MKKKTPTLKLSLKTHRKDRFFFVFCFFFFFVFFFFYSNQSNSIQFFNTITSSTLISVVHCCATAAMGATAAAAGAFFGCTLHAATSSTQQVLHRLKEQVEADLRVEHVEHIKGINLKVFFGQLTSL
jgi:hypothetical protein